MNCERCGKNEAAIQYTEIRDGKAEKYQICPQCAQKLGFDTKDDATPSPKDFPPPGKLAGMLSLTAHVKARNPSPADRLRCPGCGQTGAELRKRSLFGCPKCYEVFDGSLDPLLRRIHGAVRHRGRLPRGEEARPVDVDKLRAALESAITNEDFEEAARVRDRLRRAKSPRARSGLDPGEGETP